MFKNIFKIRNGKIFIAEPNKLENKRIFIKSELIDSELISGRNLKERYDQRLSEGHMFYAYFKNYKLIAYYWLSEIRAPLAFGEYFLFDKKFIYIWGCYVSEKFRGQGLYKLMLKEAKDIAYEKGKSKVLIYSDIKNSISIQAILNCNFKLFIDFKLIKIFKIKVLLIHNKFKKIFINGYTLKL
jgi:GNAT superfamily N-acetyltransferase